VFGMVNNKQLQYYKEVSLDVLLLEAQYLFNECSIEENPEYIRGIAELLAGVFGVLGVELEHSTKIITDIIINNPK
jgi:hypothetical protein